MTNGLTKSADIQGLPLTGRDGVKLGNSRDGLTSGGRGAMLGLRSCDLVGADRRLKIGHHNFGRVLVREFWRATCPSGDFAGFRTLGAGEPWS